MLQPAEVSLRPRRNRYRMPCGCAIPFVSLALVCLGIFVVSPELREASEYNKGLFAFNRADCATAIQHFDAVVQGADWGIYQVNGLADQMRNECLAFIRATNAEAIGHFGIALANYLDFLVLYPASGLTGIVADRIAALFAKSNVSRLAAHEACDRLGLLDEGGYLPQLDEQLPELLYYCGKTYEQADELENAVAVLYRVVREYPDSAVATLARDDAARLRFEIADREEHPPLPPPDVSGTASRGTSVIVVHDASSELIRITTRGPQVIMDEVPACSTCTHLSEKPKACSKTGPTIRYTLTPGWYDVLVEVVGTNGVTPYVGNWELDTDTEYSACYYIVARPAP